MSSPFPPPWLAAFQQALAATGGQFTSFAQASAAGLDPAAIAAGYQQLFMPAAPIAGPPPGTATAAALRLQRATQAFGDLAARAAVDAATRFQATLNSTDPTLPKITTLRSLHALWIDCGEAAHAAAAHAPAWAAAQSELLNALVAWRAEAGGASG